VKRRFRAAILTQPEIFDPNLDYVLIVNAAATKVSFERIQSEVRDLFQQTATRWASELESS
jgi:ribonuclease P protein component